MSNSNGRNGSQKSDKGQAVIDLINAAAAAEADVNSKGKPFPSPRAALQSEELLQQVREEGG
jgi:hypothetical protein